MDEPTVEEGGGEEKWEGGDYIKEGERDTRPALMGKGRDQHDAYLN